MKALFLLSCLLVLASASRMPDIFDDPTVETVSGAAVQDWLHATRSECNRRGSKKGSECFDEPVTVMFKYEVKPNQKDEFEKAWLELKDDMKEEKGLDKYALVKTKLDNVYFISFTCWDSLYAFADHMDTDHAHEFRDTCKELGIEWRMCMLKKVTKQETRYEREEENRPGRGSSKRPAHILVKYDVPPQKHEEFLEAWEDAQREVDKEKGIRTFKLAKVASDNTLFVGCYTWESYDAFLDHLESDHGCRLREDLDEHQVVYTMIPHYVISGNV